MQKNSYNYEELISCGKGKLFGEGNAKLPLPPMLMFDRITEIKKDILLSNYNDSFQLIGESNNILDIDKAIKKLEEKIKTNDSKKQEKSRSAYYRALAGVFSLFFLYTVVMSCMYFFTKDKLRSKRNENKSYSDIDIIVIE